VKYQSDDLYIFTEIKLDKTLSPAFYSLQSCSSWINRGSSLYRHWHPSILDQLWKSYDYVCLLH